MGVATECHRYKTLKGVLVGAALRGRPTFGYVHADRKRRDLRARTDGADPGITTVIGCLAVDTTMKTMAGLLARAKALKEEGLAAFIWSGGYNVPPTTITDSIRDDIMFIEEVVDAGEIAISDERSTDPTGAGVSAFG